MAPPKCLAATLAYAVLASASESEFLSQIVHGQVPKQDVEVVLAQHDEDVSWSDPYKSVRTVYCKGGAHCAADSIKLDNVGREGHTYLHHIVKNYDNLSKWTVFSQGQKPSEGYFGQNKGGGHLLTGIHFEDYLTQSQAGSDSHFVFSSKIHLPTMQHAIRSSFRVDPATKVPGVSGPHAKCPAGESDDVWRPFSAMPELRTFIAEKCDIEEASLAETLQVFWEDIIRAPMPKNQILHYAQGARFAVSRDRLLQRPKASYESLLRMLEHERDPCMNYLFEWAWYYILVSPQQAPCQMVDADLEPSRSSASSGAARFLSGVSGVSGVSGPADPSTGDSQMQCDVCKDFSGGMKKDAKVGDLSCEVLSTQPCTSSVNTFGALCCEGKYTGEYPCDVCKDFTGGLKGDAMITLDGMPEPQSCSLWALSADPSSETCTSPAVRMVVGAQCCDGESVIKCDGICKDYSGGLKKGAMMPGDSGMTCEAYDQSVCLMEAGGNMTEEQMAMVRGAGSLCCEGDFTGEATCDICEDWTGELKKDASFTVEGQTMTCSMTLPYAGEVCQAVKPVAGLCCDGAPKEQGTCAVCQDFSGGFLKDKEIEFDGFKGTCQQVLARTLHDAESGGCDAAKLNAPYVGCCGGQFTGKPKCDLCQGSTLLPDAETGIDGQTCGTGNFMLAIGNLPDGQTCSGVRDMVKSKCCKAAEAVTIIGEMTLEVADPAAFVADAGAATKVASGIADALGVPAEWVTVVLELVDAPTRRLAEVYGSLLGRRLATQQVKVSYTIKVPADNTDSSISGGTLEAKLSNAEAMKSTMTSAISEKTGVTVTVKDVAAPAKASPTTTTKPMITEAGAMRAASPAAAAAAVLALLAVSQ